MGRRAPYPARAITSAIGIYVIGLVPAFAVLLLQGFVLYAFMP